MLVNLHRYLISVSVMGQEVSERKEVWELVLSTQIVLSSNSTKESGNKKVFVPVHETHNP